jgi:hypothetical protein
MTEETGEPALTGEATAIGVSSQATPPIPPSGVPGAGFGGPEPSASEPRGHIRWRGAGSLLALASLMTILGDWLFAGAEIGVNAVLFGMALFLVVLIGRVARGQRMRRRLGRHGALVVAAFLGFIALLVLEPGWIASALALASLWSLARGLAAGWPSKAIFWFTRVAALPADLVTRMFGDAGIMHRWFRRHPSLRRRNPWSVLLRWLVPVLVASVFAILFIASNPIIESWSRSFGQSLADLWTSLTSELTIQRVGLWWAVGLVTWTFLRGRTLFRSQVLPETVSLPQAKRAFLIRTLVLCNVVFAAQSVLDLLYLTGGSALPPQLTFAEYAHRGAYPLIAAALLAGLFVLVTFRPGGEGERSPAARRLVSVWIAQSMLLSGTAAWRLWLYVEQYSLSRWRLATVIWLALVAIGLALLVERIRRRASHEWLFSRIAIATTLVLTACAVPSFDGLIARYNVAHCREVGSDAVPIDLTYLESLGEEAIPALDRLAAASIDDAVANEASKRAARLRKDLADRMADWRAWSWRRAAIE